MKPVTDHPVRVRARQRRRIALRSLTLTLGLGTQAALAEPHGGVIVGGSGSIAGSNGQQVVTQHSSRLAIDWQGFSLAPGERTEFRQPDAASVALNRVVGGAPSEIHGHIVANGQVFLVNPNGVLFGRGAQVDVGGVVASTLDLSTQDFMAGRATFTDTGRDGRVVNEGALRADDGGYVALIGRQVVNAGRIEAPGGTIALAAGEQVSLKFDTHSLVDLSVDRATLDALVENRAALQANGGTVLLSARARDALLDTVVNNTGVIEANTVGKVGGVVRLGATDGVVTSSGTLAARGDDAGEQGGSVEITGQRIALTDAAVVDATGDAGGGSVHVGGSEQGRGPLPNSEDVFVGAATRIDASARTQGAGGRVVVYADDTARMHGHIAATGGAQGGDGGFVETSGKQALDLTAMPLVTAAAGAPGTWLIDPLNIVISATANQCVGLAGCVNGPNWTSSASGATLGANLITGALNAGQNVTITTGAGGTEAGDITLLGSPTIQKSAGATDVTLTLSAHNDIGLTAPVAQSGGAAVGRLNVVLRADSDNNGLGNVAIRSAISTGGGTLTATGQNVTVLSNLTTSGTARRDGGAINLTATPTGVLNISGGAMAASGGTSTGAGTNGGNVNLSGGSVIARAITANGGNAGGANQAGGRAGTITLDSTGAVPAVSLGGNLTARGGNGTGSGAGGAGGTVSSSDPVALAAAVSVSTAGGTGGTRGAGGNVSFANVDSSVNARRGFTVDAGTGSVSVAALGGSTPLGAVSLTAGGGITSGNITTSGLPNQAGFAVSLNAGTTGAINVGNILTRGTTTTGIGRAGGAVTLSGRTLAAGAIDTTGSNSAIASAGGAGGAVSLTAAGTNARITLARDIVANGGNGIGNAGGASGAVALNGPVTLANDVAITNTPGNGSTRGAGGAITTSATTSIDSDGVPRSLDLNGSGPVTLLGAIGQSAPLANLGLSGTGTIVLPATRLLGNLDALTTGALADSGPLSVGGSTSLDAAAIALDDAGNDFVGAVSTRTTAGATVLNDANGLVLGASNSAGPFTAIANGDVRILPGAAVTSAFGDVVLAARGGNFINDSGPGAIAAPAGRWLVYATSPGGNLLNGLTPGNARPNFYNRTIDSAPPATIEPGNHFVFSFQPTLTVTPDAIERRFGDIDPALTFTSTGLLAGDALADAFDGTLARAPGETVGVYAIDVPVATSPIGYAIDARTANFTIAQRPITLAADARSRVYGDADPALGFSVLNGALVATPDGALAGALARAPGEDVGRYAIGQGTLANPNYAITFVPGDFDITPRPIALRANSANRIFGDADPAFDFTLTAGSLVALPGGGLTGALARAAGESVGNYAITQGTLGNPNYQITFTPGTLAIAPRAVTLAALGGSKRYGDADPLLGFTVTSGTLAALPEGALNGSLARAAGEDVGRYAVTQGSLNNPNYLLSFTPGSFDVLPRPLAVRANDVSRAVGASNPPFSASFDGFAFGEGPGVLGGTLSFDTPAGPDAVAGAYRLSPSGLTATNYALAFVDGTLSVFEPLVVIPPVVAPPSVPPVPDAATDEAILSARQIRPGLPPIADLARLQIVDDGILLPAELR